MSSMPFRQLKSFLKILIGFQYQRKKLSAILDELEEQPNT